MSDIDPDEFSKTKRYKAPEGARHGETVGGGFIVVERTRKKNRLRPSMWPLEIESYEKAAIAVIRLQKKHPAKSFAILQQVGFAPSPEIKK